MVSGQEPRGEGAFVQGQGLHRHPGVLPEGRGDDAGQEGNFAVAGAMEETAGERGRNQQGSGECIK